MLLARCSWTRTLGLALAAACAAAPARAGEVDRYLPDDTEVVISANVRQVLDSPLFKKLGLNPAREALKDLDLANDILKDLGFDPFKDLDRVVLAGPVGDEPDKGLVIVHGTFDLAKFKAKGDEAARDNPDVLKIHKVPDGAGGQYLLYEVTPGGDGDMPLFVALPTKDTLLVSPGKDYVVDALKKVRRKAAPALKNKAFQALLGKMDDRQSLAVAAEGSAVGSILGRALGKGGNLPEAAKDRLAKIEALGGGITVADDIKIEVVVSAKTADDAKEIREAADKGLKQLLTLAALAATAEPKLNPALEVVKTLKVTGKDKLVIFKGQVSADVIEESLKKDG
jgi:hypothetical protein